MVFNRRVEGLVAQETIMMQERLYWEYLLPEEKENRIQRVGRDLMPMDSVEQNNSNYEVLFIEDLNTSGLKREPIQNIEKLLEAKKIVYISLRGYSRRLIRTLELNGFKIKELYWVYRREKSRVFWLIPLLHSGAFFFSSNAILSVMADNALIFKRAAVYILFRIGVLKYFIENCIVAKKAV